jgi:hypothetical protein
VHYGEMVEMSLELGLRSWKVDDSDVVGDGIDERQCTFYMLTRRCCTENRL